MDTKIKAEFWTDPALEELGPEEKLSLLWLMTAHVNACGWVEIGKKRFEFETGCPWEALGRACEALGSNVIRASNGGLWLRQFIRHQFGSGPRLARNNIASALVGQLLALPAEVREEAWATYPELKPREAPDKQALAKPLASPPKEVGVRVREGEGVLGKEGAGRKPAKIRVDAAQVEAIYQAYPKKVGKAAALKAIEKVLRAGTLDGSALLARVEAFAKATADWDRQFIPHPATWMNDGRYDDDPAEWVRADSRLPRGGVENSRKKNEGAAGGDGRTASKEPEWDWRAIGRVLWPEAGNLPPWEHLPASSRSEIRDAWRKKLEGTCPQDFPWRAVAVDHLGWEIGKDVLWEYLTDAQRAELRSAWGGLSKETKAALWELSNGGGRDHE